MKTRKRIILVLVAVLLLFTSLLIYSERDLFSKNPMVAFSRMVEQGYIDSLTLTIYYVRAAVYFGTAGDADDLLRGWSGFSDDDAEKVVVKGSQLKEHIDLLQRMSNTELVPVPIENPSRINVKIYYVFKTIWGQKVLDIAMWGYNGSVFINDVEFEKNTIYYEMMVPFLSEAAAQEVRREITIEEKRRNYVD